MGKRDEKQTKKRAHKATGKSKHEALHAGESKLKKQSSLDTLVNPTLGHWVSKQRTTYRLFRDVKPKVR